METKTKKKISVKNVKLSDEKAGFAFSGVFKGIVQGTPFETVDKKTGEVITKQLRSAIFESDEGERVAYLADMGLVQGLTDAMVKEGDKIEVVKLEKRNISKSRTMNQYDIFAL